MVRLTIYSLIFILSHVIASGQPCFPNGKTFSTQSSIDLFQTYYPDCTEIEGDLTIKRSSSGSDPITNLNGLSVLTSVGGSLKLQALASNYPLMVTDMTGLDNLTSIGGDLSVHGTWLENFSGMEGLLTIGGNLTIFYNDSLISLSGLDNVGAITGNISIISNENLFDCNISNICDYLSNPAGIVRIYNNATGCKNPSEIASDCGFTLECLPYGNYYLFSQDEIDNFQTNYQNCTEISGSMEVNGLDVSSLAGLNNITSVELTLSIGNHDFGNPMLTSLDGLENLQTVGGNLIIWSNANLSDISGISNVVSLGGDLWIGRSDVLTNLNSLQNYTSIGGDLSIGINTSLTDISGLINITSIGGGSHISIQSNDILTSLYGLDNIDTSSINGITIRNNPMLSSCEVRSICEFLTVPNGFYYLDDNAGGCNTREEVLEACETAGIPDITGDEGFYIYPNPATKKIFIVCYNEINVKEISIYNQLGQRLIHENNIANALDISHLDKGLYFVELVAGELIFRELLIVN